MNAQPQYRYALLDGLRGFSALSVLLFHIGHWLHIPGIASNSNFAVDFFFCLSGFVLGFVYWDRLEGGMSAREFMAIRLWRLMPLIVVATCISAPFVLARALMLHQPLYLATFATVTLAGLLNIPFFHAPQAIGGPQLFPLNGPQYTLFLELFANMVWACGRRWLSVPVLIVITIICAVILGIFGFSGDETATFWLGIPRVFLSFNLGLLLFCFGRRKSPARTLPALSYIPAFLLMMGLFYYPSTLPGWFHLIWALGISPLLIWWGARIQVKGPMMSLCFWSGALSFPIYVLHYPIFCWVNAIYQKIMKAPSPIIEPPLIILAVLAASYIAYRWLDYNKLRRLVERRLVMRPAKI